MEDTDSRILRLPKRKKMSLKDMRNVAAGKSEEVKLKSSMSSLMER